MSVKLQKRDLDVYQAYTNSNNVTDDLQDIWDNIKDIWTEWFDLAVTTAANAGVVPSILRRTNQQQHRDNVPAQTPFDYYERAVAIPLLDHLQSEMKTYFNPTNDTVLSSLFNLLPELVAIRDRNPDFEAALEFYENDPSSPNVVDVELLRWKRKWCSTDDAELSPSAVQTLAACDREFVSNIHTLIRILCTLPITSAECERSFSTLRRLKTYLRSTMSSERESGLVLMNINYHWDKYWGRLLNGNQGIFCLLSVNAKVLYVHNVRILDQPFSLEPIWTPPARNPGYAPVDTLNDAKWCPG